MRSIFSLVSCMLLAECIREQRSVRAAIIRGDGTAAVHGHKRLLRERAHQAHEQTKDQSTDESHNQKRSRGAAERKSMPKWRTRRAQHLDAHQVEEALGHPIGPNVKIESIGRPADWGSNTGGISRGPGAEGNIHHLSYTSTSWSDSWGDYGKSGKGSKIDTKSSKSSYDKSYKGKGGKSWVGEWSGSMPPVSINPSSTRVPSASPLPTDPTDRMPSSLSAMPSDVDSAHPSTMPSVIANNIEDFDPSTSPSDPPTNENLSASPSVQPSSFPSTPALSSLPSTTTSIPSSSPSNVPSLVNGSEVPSVASPPPGVPTDSIGESPTGFSMTGSCLCMNTAIVHFAVLIESRLTTRIKSNH